MGLSHSRCCTAERSRQDDRALEADGDSEVFPSEGCTEGRKSASEGEALSGKSFEDYGDEVSEVVSELADEEDNAALDTARRREEDNDQLESFDAYAIPPQAEAKQEAVASTKDAGQLQKTEVAKKRPKAVAKKASVKPKTEATETETKQKSK